MLVALSPTVFAYPLNIAVLGLAFAELAAAVGQLRLAQPRLPLTAPSLQ